VAPVVSELNSTPIKVAQGRISSVAWGWIQPASSAGVELLWQAPISDKGYAAL
jgi:hypothetical protein